MFNKTTCSSKKKIRMVNQTPTKSHTASIHLKTQEDLCLDLGRLPLKELIPKRRDDNQASLKKLFKMDCLNSTRVKESSRSAKKISVQQVPGRGILTTDRSSNCLNSKRMRTETDNIFEDSHISNMKLMQEYSEENRKLKQDLKRKKECVEVKAEDLVALLNQYSKLKARSNILTKQLDFYRTQDDPISNSVLKVLTK